MTTPTEPTWRDIDAGGVRLHVGEMGAGPAVLLLHGGGPGANGWSNFSANAPALAEHVRVIIPDLPGFGRSDPFVFTEPRPIGTARVLVALLDALSIQRAHIVGNSAGGSAAIEIAIEWPARIDRLVLIGTGNAGPSIFSPLPTEGDKYLGPAMRDPTPERMRQLLEIMVYDASLVTDELVASRVASASDPAQRDARRKSVRKAGEPRAELERISAPTLLVWGRDDRFNPYDIGIAALGAIADARLHIFNRCGHWAQIEHADEFNRLVLAHLGAQ